MLSQFALQRVRAFERIRAGNFHLPPVAALRPQDYNSPVSGAVCKDVFDEGDHVALRVGATGIVHFDGHGHRLSLLQQNRL